MIFIATPETLAASGYGKGRNLYLTEKHLMMMIGAAFLVHLLVLAGIEFWPREEVNEVPVRTLNIKLGGGQDLSPMPLAALPALESVDVPDKPIKAVANAPKAPPPASKPMNLGTLDFSKPPVMPKPTPALALQQPKPAIAQVPKPPAEPKRVKVDERLRPMQNPIPANIANPTRVQLRTVEQTTAAPVPAMQASELPAPVAAGGGRGPAIASHPTQYVRAGSQAAGNPAIQGSGSAATPGSASGSISVSEIRARYEQQISQWLAKHIVYPSAARMLGQHGRPVLRIRIDRSGNLKYSAIDTSTGYRLIDDAALDMARRANPYPAPPADYPGEDLLEFKIPVSFDLN